MRKLLLSAALLLGLALPVAAQVPIALCMDNPAHTSCAAELTPAPSTATESSHVFKASAAVVAGFQANNWSTSTGLTVMVFDAAAAPSNGTVTPCIASAANPVCLVKWYGIPAAPSSGQPATIGVNWAPGPMLHLLNGFVVVCSSTGPTTLTLSTNCTFSAENQ